jgi:hypothetical protein
MTEDARGRHGSVFDLFDVCRAHTAGRHLDQDLIGPDARNGKQFQSEIVDAAIHYGAHLLWNLRQHAKRIE